MEAGTYKGGGKQEGRIYNREKRSKQNNDEKKKKNSDLVKFNDHT